jgi:aminoglycoside phosphotransferase family enzyme/predicted kinase
MTTPGARPWDVGLEPLAELRATHSAAVLLLGDRAFKMKLPVRLAFLDFSEHRARAAACRRELDLNRRLAPDAYLGMGSLQQPGAEDEPVVVMRRFPDSGRLRSMVLRGEDVAGHVVRIARVMAAFHAAARRGPEIEREGTRDAIRERWEASFAQVRAAAHPGIDDRVLAEVERLTRTFLEGRAELFAGRVSAGRIVEGHGDLLAEDIFCTEKGPQILDCLDFDLRLRSLDQLDDVCCLAMDLESLGATHAAELLLTTYVEHTGDPAPAALTHHFIAYRAFVRAKVGCLRGAAGDVAGIAELAGLCLAHLRAGAVRLVLVGGAPGTGKTTLAGGLADRCGYVTINSDRVRKELAGLDPMAPAPAAYGSGLYDSRSTDATYDELLRRARLLLSRGESVVLDATWADPRHRAAAARLADLTYAELVPLRCVLPVEVARARVADRAGPSDAGAGIVARATAAWAPWDSAFPVDTTLAPDECAALAADAVGHHGLVARPGQATVTSGSR